MLKYELTDKRKYGLYQIRALRDFSDVRKGDLGGYVEAEYNLGHGGNCWVYGDAGVFNRAKVAQDAKVMDEAKIKDSAVVSRNAIVQCKAEITHNAWVFYGARVGGHSLVIDNARVGGTALLLAEAFIYGNAKVEKGVYTSGVNTYRYMYDINRNGNEIRCSCQSKTFEEWMRRKYEFQNKEGLSDMDMGVLERIFIKVQQEIKESSC